MSIKTKNEESGQLSLLARFQRVIGHGRTQQFEINASPSDCLRWMESLKGNPEYKEVSVETQAHKRPYQLTARVRRPRVGTIGVVIGDIVQSPMSESKSIVTLHFYHTLASMWIVVMVASLCLMVGLPATIMGFDAILPPIADRYPVENFLCYGGIGVSFIGMGVFGMIKLLSGDEPLDVVSAHLLKLNSSSPTR